MLFPLLPRVRSVSAECEVIFADVSAEIDGSTPFVTAPDTAGDGPRGGDSAIYFRWKDGVWLSPRFRTKWHRGDSLLRSGGERGYPLVTMLVSPRRRRGHATALTTRSAGFLALPSTFSCGSAAFEQQLGPSASIFEEESIGPRASRSGAPFTACLLTVEASPRT